MFGEKKVIILNKVDSPAISQAIFILKDNVSAEFSAVEEAERVVKEYMDAMRFKKRHSKAPLLFTLIVLIFSCVVAAILTRL